MFTPSFRSMLACAAAAGFMIPHLQAVAGEWVYPLDVAATSDSLIIADRNLPGVWKTDSGKLNELFKASKQFRTPLNAVRSVAVGPQGQIYAACSGSRQVYRLDEDGPKKLAGDGVGIGIPMDIAVADDGALYVSDLELHRIFRVSPDGGEPESVATIRAPRGLLWDGDSLVIVTNGEDSLVRMTPDGKLTPIVKGQKFNFAHEVSRLGDTYYVTDGYEDGVWPVALDGTVGELLKADGMTNPVGITTSGDKLLIIDPRASSLYALTVDDAGAASIAPVSLQDAIPTGTTAQTEKPVPLEKPAPAEQPKAETPNADEGEKSPEP